MAQRQKEKKLGRFRTKAMRLLESGKWSLRRMRMPKQRRKELDDMLMFAAWNGDDAEVNRLIDAGASIEATNACGTALMNAASRGRIKTCVLLLEKLLKEGGNIRNQANAMLEHGQTALFSAGRTSEAGAAFIRNALSLLESMGEDRLGSFISSFRSCAQ